MITAAMRWPFLFSLRDKKKKPRDKDLYTNLNSEVLNLVELNGIEPMTSSLPAKRSPS